MNVVVGLILVFAVLVLMLLFLNRSSRSFLDSLTCDEGSGTGLIQMPKADGCQAEANREDYYLGFFGRKEGYVCCEITNYDPKNPATWGPGGSGTGPNAGVAVQQFTMTSALTSKTLADGATVPVYASNTATGNAKSPNKIDIAGSISCPQSDSCNDITCEETLTTTTGKDLGKEPTNLLKTRLCTGSTINSPTSNPTGIKGILGSLEIIPDPAYADQTLLYTLRIKKGDAELETYTLKFRITSPVKYAGLTPTWSRRKEVTAACESPIACSDILFKTVEKPTSGVVASCPLDVTPSSATEIKTTYCVVKDGQLTDTCGASLNACTQALLSLNDAEYSGVHTALLTAVERGLIQDNIAFQFASMQGLKSTYSCIKNTGTISGSAVTADNGAALYRVPVDPTTGRATFTLEHKSFEGKYVCLYGRDKTDPNTVYTAKGPVKLALDVTPPTAHLEFKPGSLQLRFGCTDQPDGGLADPDLVSGCKDTFGTAYISQTAPFLAALVSQDTPQNAAAWCPPYANAGGYSFEARPITQYKGNEIRVLCLRVEDNAGNAGVAMTTVYNTYDLLLNALAGAVNEGR